MIILSQAAEPVFEKDGKLKQVIVTPRDAERIIEEIRYAMLESKDHGLMWPIDIYHGTDTIFTIVIDPKRKDEESFSF